MPNDSQKLVFKSFADNKAMFECLKEYLIGKFEERTDPTGLTNAELGEIARAQYVGLNKIYSAFAEIASFKTQDNKPEGTNPAR